MRTEAGLAKPTRQLLAWHGNANKVAVKDSHRMDVHDWMSSVQTFAFRPESSSFCLVNDSWLCMSDVGEAAFVDEGKGKLAWWELQGLKSSAAQFCGLAANTSADLPTNHQDTGILKQYT